MAKNYVNVSVPSELIDLADKTWKKSKKAYRSRSEFVISAIRDKIDKEEE